MLCAVDNYFKSYGTYNSKVGKVKKMDQILGHMEKD